MTDPFMTYELMDRFHILSGETGMKITGVGGNNYQLMMKCPHSDEKVWCGYDLSQDVYTHERSISCWLENDEGEDFGTPQYIGYPYASIDNEVEFINAQLNRKCGLR